MDPIDIYSKIQPLIQNEIRQAMEDKSNSINDRGLFKVDSVFHSHNGIDGPRINASDIVGLNNNGFASTSRVVTPTENLQSAIDSLNKVGGGSLYLQSGSYIQQTALVGYSSVRMIGISPSQTIIDFNGTSSGLTFAESNAYTTGTITVASGVAITGSGTLWLANVTAGMSLFLGTRWYTIAAVTDNTHLILAEAYGDNVTLPSTYRISFPAKGFSVSNLSLQNSTSGVGLTLSGARQFFLSNVLSVSCNKGVYANNVSEMAIDEVITVAGSGIGFEMLNVGLSNITDLNSSGNSSHGVKMYNVKTVYMAPGSSTANGNIGYSMEFCTDISMLVNASGNGDKGIKMISNCNNVSVLPGSPVRGNVSDGISLTASAIGCKAALCDIQGNGGYGINIVAASDVGTLLSSNYLVGNTLGQMNNAGTGSIGRGNYNVADFG